MKKIKVSKYLVTFSLIMAIFFTAIISYIIHKNNHKELNLLMKNQISQMQNSIDKALLGAYALEALVLGANGKNIDLEKVGKFLIHDEYKKYVKNILIAPDGVVLQVYPHNGNDAVIGLNLLSKQNESNKEALKAMEQNRTLVVTGPYNLIEGGVAISGRLKVTLPQVSGSSKDWGLVSITLDFFELMKYSAINLLEEHGYAYRVLKLDAYDNEYKEVFYNSYDIGDDADKEEVEFLINSMKFKVEAYPLKGWENYLYIFVIGFCSFWLILLIAVLFSFYNAHWISVRRQATIDMLTNVANRTTGEARIKGILKSTNFGTFILLDIDHFKSVNDILGHRVGDKVLKETAKIYRSIFGDDDIICRLGGDEFIIFLPYKQSKDALKIKLEKLLNAMRKTVKNGDKEVRVSCSMGIAFVQGDADSFDHLYEYADKALYFSKVKGRDCYTFYSDISKSDI